MAFNRRKVVERAIESHKNALGEIPFMAKSKTGFAFAPVSELHQYESNKRNGLPTTRFDLIDPSNGNTVGFLGQCGIEKQVLDAYAALESGKKPVVTFVSGARLFKPDFRKGGIPVVSVKAITISYPEVAAAEPEIDPFLLDGSGMDIAPGVRIQ